MEISLYIKRRRKDIYTRLVLQYHHTTTWNTYLGVWELLLSLLNLHLPWSLNLLEYNVLSSCNKCDKLYEEDDVMRAGVDVDDD